jgi:hypothetical protein
VSPYQPFGAPSTAPGYDDGILIETPGQPPVITSPIAPAPTGAHPAAGEEVGKTCPYCRFPLKPGEQVMTCPACKVPHHADCWSENRGCTTYGCQGGASAAPAQPVATGFRPPVVNRPLGPGGLPSFDSLQQTELLGRANNALILALIGTCCAPLGLVGLFMGIGLLGDIKRLNAQAPQANGKAIAAIVLGVAETLGWLIYLLAAARH